MNIERRSVLKGMALGSLAGIAASSSGLSMAQGVFGAQSRPMLPSLALVSSEAAQSVFLQGIHAGMTHVNDIPVNDEANAPFGGEKNSGIGRFNGDWAIDEFTTDHWITLQHAPRTYPF